MNPIEEKCKAKGVRLTEQRKIIAQVMHKPQAETTAEKRQDH